MAQRKVAEFLRLGQEMFVRNVSEGRRRATQENLTEILSHADAFDRRHEAISNDADLTPQGREKALVKLAAKTMEGLKVFDGRAANIRSQATTIERAMFQKAAHKRPTDIGERLSYELRQREIRDDLRRLDPIERLNAYLGATDPEVIDAFETAPPALVKVDRNSPLALRPFLDPERVAAVKIERARSKAPEQAAEMEELFHVGETLQIAVSNIRHEILAQVPAARPEAGPPVVGPHGVLLVREPA
jgi:hypothetical protein